ncbi:hypothetical protein COCNU_02G003850 [Cocos nucifera]|uniref:Uncharacterized protein n=1 Tax=Cocos nucifera TaxID=13894 RepID=A0A8K0HYT5_COCNU|nr:hypothetical protein COCNU_02G003850 [Cocos nucifera]
MAESMLSARWAPPSPRVGKEAGGGDASKTRKHASLDACRRLAPQERDWKGGALAAMPRLRLPPPTRLPGRSLLLPLSDPRLRLFLIPVRLLRNSFGRQHRQPRLRIRPRRALVSKHGKTVEWTTKDLLKFLEEFVPIYETHPIKNNKYVMGFKPDLMIESGVFKGHSTWVLC